jgi:hypothetical protein
MGCKGCKTGPPAESPAEKAAFESSFRKLSAFKEGIYVRLQKERPADVVDLRAPRHIRGSFNTDMMYYDYATWLWRYDENNIYGTQVNISSYRVQRDIQLNDVLKLVAGFDPSKRLSVKALSDEISDAGGPRIIILPYWSSTIYPKFPWGSLAPDAIVSFLPGIKQAGIFFTPYNWSRNGKPGTFGFLGPGSDADDVLFHELVHAVRRIKGVTSDKKEMDDDFGNEEEFVAIVLTNIYLAEKGKTQIRADHHSFSPLGHPSNFLHVQKYRTVLHQLRHDQPKFYDTLAGIPEDRAWWNPIRELKASDG